MTEAETSSTMPTLAAVDIGSNTIKLTVASIAVDGRLVEHHTDAETVRLGAGLVEGGTLDPARSERALGCLMRFRDAAVVHGAEALMGVATEALRRAADGDAFLRRVERETGWPIEIISGDEEGRLTFEGLRALVRHDDEAIIADIGGGSTELMWSQRGSLQEVRSLPIGSGRLTDEWVRTDPPTTQEFDACRHAALRLLRAGLSARLRENAGNRRLLVSGGTGVYLAALVGTDDSIGVADVERAVSTLTTVPAAALATSLGIAQERARVLPAGVAIVTALRDVARTDTHSTAESGLRRGLLFRAYARLQVTPSGANSGL